MAFAPSALLCWTGAGGGHHDDWGRDEIADSDVWQPAGSPETQSVRLHFLHWWFIGYHMVRMTQTRFMFALSLLNTLGCLYSTISLYGT